MPKVSLQQDLVIPPRSVLAGNYGSGAMWVWAVMGRTGVVERYKIKTFIRLSLRYMYNTNSYCAKTKRTSSIG